MNRQQLTALIERKKKNNAEGLIQINVHEDLVQDCAYVDFLLASALNKGRCAPILRNLMVMYSAGVPQRAGRRDYLFEPAAICETIKVLEGSIERDLTKGPIQYKSGPLVGLWKKHFFQASFLAENMLNELKQDGVGIIHRKLSEYYGRGKYMGRALDEIDCVLIAEAFSHDAIERRADRRASNRDGGLTGEHLIYAALPAGKLYLYASFHNEDPKRISDCVRAALDDFPDLANVVPVFAR